MSRTYRARSGLPLEEMVLTLRRSVGALLTMAAPLFREDDGAPALGLGVHKASDALIRSYTDAPSGIYLLEFAARTPADGFELFVVPHVDGDLRVGWRRPWHDAEEPPGAWAAVARCVTIGDPVSTQQEPDFAVLLASVAAGGIPTIAYRDAEAMAGLAADVRHLREITARQAQQVRKAQLALAARVDVPEPLVPPPAQQREWRLDDLAEWADLHADAVTILPRAIAEAKKSVFENHVLVFEALDMLANLYRLVKRSEAPREDLKARADALGLFMGGSVDPGIARAYRDAYFVMYGGRRRWLDQHVGRGTSRDPRYSLRIYFFWDDESERVVVGWLPTHLPNSMT